MSMVSHGQKRSEDNEAHHSAAIKYYTEVCKVDLDIETLHHVRGSIITNAINTRSHTGANLRGIYPVTSRLNNGCCPNVTLRSDSQGTLFVRAAVHIKKGDHLSFSYLNPTDPIWSRQSQLLSIYYFQCLCNRCEDPHELNTYLSSPKCSSCPDGYIIPMDDWISPWQCSSCQAKVDSSQVCVDIDTKKYSIERRIKTPESAQILMKEIASDFHCQHYFWLSVAQTVLRTLRKDNSLSSLKLRRDLWNNVLSVYSVLDPGYTRRRGNLCNCCVLISKQNHHIINYCNTK